MTQMRAVALLCMALVCGDAYCDEPSLRPDEASIARLAMFGRIAGEIIDDSYADMEKKIIDASPDLGLVCEKLDEGLVCNQASDQPPALAKLRLRNLIGHRTSNGRQIADIRVTISPRLGLSQEQLVEYALSGWAEYDFDRMPHHPLKNMLQKTSVATKKKAILYIGIESRGDHWPSLLVVTFVKPIGETNGID